MSGRKLTTVTEFQDNPFVLFEIPEYLTYYVFLFYHSMTLKGNLSCQW